MKRLGLLIVVALCACEPPPVHPSADLRQQTDASRIEGEVVTTSSARGNAIVFLFDADRPPPPQGTGRPLSFTVVSKDALFKGAAGLGPFTAPFSFSLVAPGRYTVRGFIDHNDCEGLDATCRKSDFIPWYSVTDEPNAGDVGGAFVDPSTLAVQTVEIAKQPDGSLNAVSGVSVSFADSAAVPTDRPAFEVADSQTTQTPQGNLVRLTLRSKPIRDGVVDERQPVFLVRLKDENNDGVPDDDNKDGVPDLWPKVFVRKVADEVPTGLVDENDLDKNGVLDATGVDYAHADGTKDGVPDAVVLAAGFDPTALLPQLFDSMGNPIWTPVPTNELTLVVKPLALDASNPVAPALLASVPQGHYAITVMQFTGQTWRLPNELQPTVAPALGLPTVVGQEFVLSEP